LSQQTTYISEIKQETVLNDANIRLVNDIKSIKGDFLEIDKIKKNIEDIVTSGTSYTNKIKKIYELSKEYRRIIDKVKDKIVELTDIEAIVNLKTEINIYSDIDKVFDNYILDIRGNIVLDNVQNIAKESKEILDNLWMTKQL